MLDLYDLLDEEDKRRIDKIIYAAYVRKYGSEIVQGQPSALADRLEAGTWQAQDGGG